MMAMDLYMGSDLYLGSMDMDSAVISPTKFMSSLFITGAGGWGCRLALAPAVVGFRIVKQTLNAASRWKKNLYVTAVKCLVG